MVIYIAIILTLILIVQIIKYRDDKKWCKELTHSMDCTNNLLAERLDNGKT